MRVEVIKPSQIPQDWYGGICGLDLETENLTIDSEICLCSLHNPKTDVMYVVPVKTYADENSIVADRIEKEELEILKKFIQSIRVCGHNLEFDLRMILYHWGVEPADIYLDTMILARLFQLKVQGLKDMVLRIEPRLTDKIRHFSDVADTQKPPFRYNMDDEEMIQYSGLDAYLPFVIVRHSAEQIKKYEKIIKMEMKFLKVAVRESAHGLRIDMNKFNETREKFGQDNEQKLQELRDLIADPGFRPSATADKKHLLIDILGCSTPITTPKGEPSMSDQSLERMLDSTNQDFVVDVINRIREYNSNYSVWNSSKKVPSYVVDNHLHFNLETIGFDGSARVYSKDYSVNQLPKPMRYSIVPEEGKKFVYFDYKTAEFLILLYWAKCEKGLEWYRSGKDLYTEIAKELLNKTEITKEERAVAKVLVLATSYGGTGWTIAKDLGCSEEEGQQFLDGFYEMFPEIGELKNKMVARGYKTGCAWTIFNRFRKLPNLYAATEQERKAGERQCVNSAVQSSCADFLKIASYRVYEEFPEVRQAFQIFDSMLIEVPKDYTDEQINKLVNRCCDFSEYFPGFKFRADVATGMSFGECQSKV